VPLAEVADRLADRADEFRAVAVSQRDQTRYLDALANAAIAEALVEVAEAIWADQQRQEDEADAAG
jgi:hypothetical protein